MNFSLNILLAEDERSVAFSISFALKADGHKIEIVSDGEEALSELTRKPDTFDVLITDHSMPRLNGVDLVETITGYGVQRKDRCPFRASLHGKSRRYLFFLD